MPAASIEAFAKKSGKSADEVEKLWNKAKGVVRKEYPDVDEKDERFFALTTGVLKKMLGIEEETGTITTSTLGTLGPGPVISRVRRDVKITKAKPKKKKKEKDCNILDELDAIDEKKKKKVKPPMDDEPSRGSLLGKLEDKVEKKKNKKKPVVIFDPPLGEVMDQLGEKMGHKLLNDIERRMNG